MEAVPPFTPEVCEAVITHMNDDHAADNLRICKGLGGITAAQAATLVAVGSTGLHFEVRTADGTETVDVPWGGPVATRADIRREVVALHDRACAALGITPPSGEEH